MGRIAVALLLAVVLGVASQDVPFPAPNPNGFSATFELTSLSTKQTFTYEEYVDRANRRHLTRYQSEGKFVNQLRIYGNQRATTKLAAQYVWSEDIATGERTGCSTTQLSGDDAWGTRGEMITVERMLGLEGAINIPTRATIAYRNLANLGGWRSTKIVIPKLPGVRTAETPITANATGYWAAPDWQFSGQAVRNDYPVVILLTILSSSAEYKDITHLHVVNFKGGVPSPKNYELPTICQPQLPFPSRSSLLPKVYASTMLLSIQSDDPAFSRTDTCLDPAKRSMGMCSMIQYPYSKEKDPTVESVTALFSKSFTSSANMSHPCERAFLGVVCADNFGRRCSFFQDSVALIPMCKLLCDDVRAICGTRLQTSFTTYGRSVLRCDVVGAFGTGTNCSSDYGSPLGSMRYGQSMQYTEYSDTNRDIERMEFVSPAGRSSLFTFDKTQEVYRITWDQKTDLGTCTKSMNSDPVNQWVSDHAQSSDELFFLGNWTRQAVYDGQGQVAGVLVDFWVSKNMSVVDRVGVVTYMRWAFPIASWQFAGNAQALRLPMQVESQRTYLGRNINIIYVLLGFQANYTSADGSDVFELPPVCVQSNHELPIVSDTFYYDFEMTVKTKSEQDTVTGFTSVDENAKTLQLEWYDHDTGDEFGMVVDARLNTSYVWKVPLDARQSDACNVTSFQDDPEIGTWVKNGRPIGLGELMLINFASAQPSRTGVLIRGIPADEYLGFFDASKNGKMLPLQGFYGIKNATLRFYFTVDGWHYSSDVRPVPLRLTAVGYKTNGDALSFQVEYFNFNWLKPEQTLELPSSCYRSTALGTAFPQLPDRFAVWFEYTERYGDNDSIATVEYTQQYTDFALGRSKMTFRTNKGEKSVLKIWTDKSVEHSDSFVYDLQTKSCVSSPPGEYDWDSKEDGSMKNGNENFYLNIPNTKYIGSGFIVRNFRCDVWEATAKLSELDGFTRDSERFGDAAILKARWFFTNEDFAANQALGTRKLLRIELSYTNTPNPLKRYIEVQYYNTLVLDSDLEPPLFCIDRYEPGQYPNVPTMPTLYQYTVEYTERNFRSGALLSTRVYSQRTSEQGGVSAVETQTGDGYTTTRHTIWESASNITYEYYSQNKSCKTFARDRRPDIKTDTGVLKRSAELFSLTIAGISFAETNFLVRNYKTDVFEVNTQVRNLGEPNTTAFFGANTPVKVRWYFAREPSLNRRLLRIERLLQNTTRRIDVLQTFEFQSFSTVVPRDVLLAPSYCLDRYETAPPPFPTIPSTFQATLEYVVRDGKSGSLLSSDYLGVYQDTQSSRVDKYIKDKKKWESSLLIGNAGYNFTEVDQSCSPNTSAVGSFATWFPMNVSGITFSEAGNRIRGFKADVWQASYPSSDYPTDTAEYGPNATIQLYWYFSKELCQLEVGEDCYYPVRFDKTITFADSLASIMITTSVWFDYSLPDKIFQLPKFCSLPVTPFSNRLQYTRLPPKFRSKLDVTSTLSGSLVSYHISQDVPAGFVAVDSITGPPVSTVYNFNTNKMYVYTAGNASCNLSDIQDSWLNLHFFSSLRDSQVKNFSSLLFLDNVKAVVQQPDVVILGYVANEWLARGVAVNFNNQVRQAQQIQWYYTSNTVSERDLFGGLKLPLQVRITFTEDDVYTFSFTQPSVGSTTDFVWASACPVDQIPLPTTPDLFTANARIRNRWGQSILMNMYSDSTNKRIVNRYKRGTGVGEPYIVNVTYYAKNTVYSYSTSPGSPCYNSSDLDRQMQLFRPTDKALAYSEEMAAAGPARLIATKFPFAGYSTSVWVWHGAVSQFPQFTMTYVHYYEMNSTGLSRPVAFRVFMGSQPLTFDILSSFGDSEFVTLEILEYMVGVNPDLGLLFRLPSSCVNGVVIAPMAFPTYFPQAFSAQIVWSSIAQAVSISQRVFVDTVNDVVRYDRQTGGATEMTIRSYSENVEVVRKKDGTCTSQKITSGSGVYYYADGSDGHVKNMTSLLFKPAGVQPMLISTSESLQGFTCELWMATNVPVTWEGRSFTATVSWYFPERTSTGSFGNGVRIPLQVVVGSSEDVMLFTWSDVAATNSDLFNWRNLCRLKATTNEKFPSLPSTFWLLGEVHMPNQPALNARIVADFDAGYYSQGVRSGAGLSIEYTDIKRSLLFTVTPGADGKQSCQATPKPVVARSALEFFAVYPGVTPKLDSLNVTVRGIKADTWSTTLVNTAGRFGFNTTTALTLEWYFTAITPSQPTRVLMRLRAYETSTYVEGDGSDWLVDIFDFAQEIPAQVKLTFATVPNECDPSFVKPPFPTWASQYETTISFIDARKEVMVVLREWNDDKLGLERIDVYSNMLLEHQTTLLFDKSTKSIYYNFSTHDALLANATWAPTCYSGNATAFYQLSKDDSPNVRVAKFASHLRDISTPNTSWSFTNNIPYLSLTCDTFRTRVTQLHPYLGVEATFDITWYFTVPGFGGGLAGRNNTRTPVGVVTQGTTVDGEVFEHNIVFTDYDIRAPDSVIFQPPCYCVSKDLKCLAKKVNSISSGLTEISEKSGGSAPILIVVVVFLVGIIIAGVISYFFMKGKLSKVVKEKLMKRHERVAADGDELSDSHKQQQDEDSTEKII